MSFQGNAGWNLHQEKLLSREEVGRVLALAKRTREEDYLFLATAANTGFRLCEILHLKPDDVKPGVLVVTRRKRKTLSPESMPVADHLSTLLQRYLRSRQDSLEWVWTGNSAGCLGSSGPVCYGGHLSRREVQRRWRYYLDKLNLYQEGRGVHSLRHYAVTEFYTVHRDLRAAQAFAGHSSSMITERYAHVVEMQEKVNAVKPTL